MGKIKTEFRYDGETYDLQGETKSQNVKVFINVVRQDICLITDAQLNVLFKIEAGQSQGGGFLQLIQGQ